MHHLTEDYGQTVPMTDEQKFIFDLKGWVTVPSVLTHDEITEIKEYLFAYDSDPKSLSEGRKRHGAGGPCQILLDHPVVAGILEEVIGGMVGEAYGFRCEDSFYMIRKQDMTGLNPHGGNHNNQGPMAFQGRPGKVYSGFTRAVWELNEVNSGDGGTLFLSGSHKLNFPIPKEHRVFESPLLEDYSCPAGSLIVFCESICHAGPTWTNPNHPRVAIFNAYNHFAAQGHKLKIPYELIETMPPKRQTLFRGAWTYNFADDHPNDYYSPDNRSL